MAFNFPDSGFAIVPGVFSIVELEEICSVIASSDQQGETFRQAKDVFAIRQLMTTLPGLVPLVFNTSLKKIFDQVAKPGYFLVKSIFFDKPADSNWYVPLHQDLTISVDRKYDLPGYGLWTQKHRQYAVQPPVEILENIVTIRIHLDDTDAFNGALHVIPGSHRNGICRKETLKRAPGDEVVCSMNAGAVMVMRSLLMHSSGRTTNQKRRRVLHLEFSSVELPAPLQWSEKLLWPDSNR